MVNHMKDVAKLLDVELGEVFKIVYKDTISSFYYRFTKETIIECSGDNINWKVSELTYLGDLILGNIQIIKLPWKPKKDEFYYMPAMDNESGYYFMNWLNDDSDKLCYHKGLVCRTKEEAIALSKKALAAIQEVENNG